MTVQEKIQNIEEIKRDAGAFRKEYIDIEKAERHLNSQLEFLSKLNYLKETKRFCEEQNIPLKHVDPAGFNVLLRVGEQAVRWGIGYQLAERIPCDTDDKELIGVAISIIENEIAEQQKWIDHLNSEIEVDHDDEFGKAIDEYHQVKEENHAELERRLDELERRIFGDRQKLELEDKLFGIIPNCSCNLVVSNSELRLERDGHRIPFWNPCLVKNVLANWDKAVENLLNEIKLSIEEITL